MRESDKNYRRKCGKRQINFYLHEGDLFEYSKKINFAKLVKEALSEKREGKATFKLDHAEVNILLTVLKQSQRDFMDIYMQTNNIYYDRLRRQCERLIERMEEWKEITEHGNGNIQNSERE